MEGTCNRRRRAWAATLTPFLPSLLALKVYLALTLNSRVKMVTRLGATYTAPGLPGGQEAYRPPVLTTVQLENVGQGEPLCLLYQPRERKKGRKKEGEGGRRGRGLIPRGSTARQRGRRGRGKDRARPPTHTHTSASPAPPGGTARAGLPHLVLLLTPEAQARRPLLEALAVIGPRLVGLELHHRGGLLLPLLLRPPLRWPGRRHPAEEWG